MLHSTRTCPGRTWSRLGERWRSAWRGGAGGGAGAWYSAAGASAASSARRDTSTTTTPRSPPHAMLHTTRVSAARPGGGSGHGDHTTLTVRTTS